MRYEAIIIGTGQAGSPLAGKLSGNGLKTAIIEKGDFGGTCVNVGCTPTKMYVASARRAYVARNSEELGVYTEKVKVDLPKIKARKDDMVKESSEGVKKFLEGLDNLTIYKGAGKFLDSHTIEVNGEKIEGDKIYINVGTRPRIPDGFKDIDYLTNDTILELESIPEHLVIVGGGYIGLEFGQMFKRFGSDVTIVEMNDKLLAHEDEDVSDEICAILENEGINVRLNAKCLSGRKENGKLIVDLDCDDDENQVEGSHVLIAAGRIPNSDLLDLDKAGIKSDDRGYIEVDDKLMTNVSHIFALGDCNGEGAFTHTAYNDYEIMSSHLFGDADRFIADRIKCYAAYIDPALARVGMSEKEAKEANVEYKVACKPMSKIARAKEMGETAGFLKILIEKDSDKIVGAAFIGPHADEIIHSIIDHMYADKPYTLIRDAVHIHPTISELIPTMLELD